MKAYGQKQIQPQQVALPHPNSLTQRTLGNQPVRVLPHADTEDHEAMPFASAITRFAHDFSLIPVHSKAPVRLQAKLKVNAPGDIYEQEADRVSEQLMRMPEPQQLQRTCTCGGDCSGCKNKKTVHEYLQTKRVQINDNSEIAVPPLIQEVLHSSGQPLDASTREFMELRFGHDFARVRVHADGEATHAAHAVRARAFTIGRDIVFGSGEYAPGTPEGKRLLAHELAHVVQQSSETHVPPGLDRGRNDPLERAADLHAERALTSSRPHLQPTSHGQQVSTSPERLAVSNHTSTQRIQRQQVPSEEAPLVSDDAVLACLLFAPMHLKSLCFALAEDGGSESKGDSEGSRGVGSGSRAPDTTPQVKEPPTPAPAPGVTPPPPPPPAMASKKLNFYHGTRWSIAKTIPNNVKAIGGGDFATGFYTHQDADDSKAEGRAIKWGRAIANMKPAEPYAGVIRFGVSENDYRQIRTGDKAKGFDLTRVDQPDFKAKQKAWLDFITSGGRKKEPVFNEKRKQWVHERRKTQPNLPYNVVEGPFYTPIKGTKDRKPRPEDFKPYAEGKQLPQQVSWANDGIKLLNSSKVDKELKQYDAKTGKPQDPPVDVASTAGQPNAAQVNKETEEAQMDMVR